MTAPWVEEQVAWGAHRTEADRRPLSSMGSSRPGVPLHSSAVPAECMCGLLESGQLARRGVIGFEAAWPHHIISVDGRMAAILRKSASELVGHVIDAVFSEAAERNAACMAASCAKENAHSVFTFRGPTEGSSRHSLFMVGTARSLRHQRVLCLELIVLPLPDDFETSRGNVVVSFQSTAESPTILCDSTLALRLGSEVSLQPVLALEASDAEVDAGHDSEIIGYRVEGQARADKLDL